MSRLAFKEEQDAETAPNYDASDDHYAAQETDTANKEADATPRKKKRRRERAAEVTAKPVEEIPEEKPVASSSVHTSSFLQSFLAKRRVKGAIGQCFVRCT